MALKEPEWMAAVLGVKAPWHVVEVRLTPQGAVSVQVEHESAQQRSWFLRRTVASRRLRWDHVGMAGRRCEVVLSLPENQRLPEALWTGEADMPFTRGLGRKVLDLLLEGVTMQQLCKLLEVPVSDLWKFKYRLEQNGTRLPEGTRLSATAATAPAAGSASAGTTPAVASAPAALANPIIGSPAPRPTATAPAAQQAAPRPAASQPSFVAQPDAPANSQLPPDGSPVWIALLKGQLKLEVQALSLKLLLSKLQREATSHADPDLHSQAAQSLSHYFRRNQALLGPEISQLARAALPVAAKPAITLPDVSDPLWLDLLTGERELDVKVLSLRLLLSKLRGQAQALQDQELRMLKLVELHRYFEKNQAALRHEISQLHHWSVH